MSERERMLRRAEVMEVTGLSATTIRRLERAGDFPQRRSLGAGAVGWLRSEVEQWLTTRPVRSVKPHSDAQNPD